MDEQTGMIPFKMQSELKVMSDRVPTLFTPTERSRDRFKDFFTSSIRNKNTRIAYYKAIARFSDWCEAWTLTDIARIKPIHIATYIEQMLQTHSKPTVKQHLAAIRSLLDYLVVGQVMEFNPAHAVRGPKYSQTKGKTPILSREEARALLNGIDTSTIIGMRDRALIAVMFYTFCRVSAALSLTVGDYYIEERRACLRLQEKGGKECVAPVNHKLDQYLHAYIKAADIEGDFTGPLFRTMDKAHKMLTRTPMLQSDAHRAIRKWAKVAGIPTPIGSHSCRGTGITDYLRNGGSLTVAAKLANHSNVKTTQLYDRRNDDVQQEEVEKIAI